MNGFEKFYEMYKSEPEGVSFCPYRLSPLGAHIDHQKGIVTGWAIDRGIRFYYGAKHNGVVELTSLSFEKRAQFVVSSVPDEKEGDWADYLRGVTKILGEKYSLRYGIKGVIEGSLPIGGLSSSAAVTIAYLTALSKLNSIDLTDWEIIRIARRAENEYVGVNCGLLDQGTEVLSKRNSLFVLDTLSSTYENLTMPQLMKPFSLIIFFSGLERALKSSNSYNLRQDECKAASYALKGWAGLEYGSFRDSFLRDVPKEVYDEYGSALPPLWRRRAEHYYSEMERVGKGTECWKKGDIDGFGSLVFESGESSIRNYECGSDELVSLYTILTKTNGVIGSRFSGAGFKGFVMAIVEKGMEDEVMKKVEKEYLKIYPGLTGKYASFVTEISDGVGEGRRR